MRSVVVPLVLLLCATACSDQPTGTQMSGQPVLDRDFDCTLGFEKLSQQILAKPAVKDWGMDSESSRIVQDDAKHTYYILTGPRHPGHPAIFKRSSGMSMDGVMLWTSVCSYGDLKPIENDLRAYDLLDASLMEERPIYHYGAPEFRSPTADHLVPPPTPPPTE